MEAFVPVFAAKEANGGERSLLQVPASEATRSEMEVRVTAGEVRLAGRSFGCSSRDAVTEADSNLVEAQNENSEYKLTFEGGVMSCSQTALVAE